MNTNKTILSLRPEGRTEALTKELIELGYQVYSIPCLTIDLLKRQNFDKFNNYQFNDIADHLNDFDIYIFVSVNAVEGFINLTEHAYLNHNKTVIAVGSKTAEKLTEYKFNKISYPKEKKQTSEYLVQLPELANIKNKKILLIRGSTSREYIAEYLQHQQAHLTECIVYNGVQPNALHKTLANDLYFIQNIQPDDLFILTTSQSILKNFNENLSSLYLEKVKQAVLIVPSDRIADYARSLGYQNIIVTNTMNDDIIKSIIEKY